MLEHVPSFDKLVHELSRWPGIGNKTAQRLAYHLLRASNETVLSLQSALRLLKERVHECPRCFSFTEQDGECRLCSNASRSDDVICVVEDPADISRIESSDHFHGRYHVLHGTISPLDGVGPDDLKIAPLLERIEAGLAGRGPKVIEVILALDADLEGDTTVLYLAKILASKDVRLTRIAHGVPIGGDIDYIDHRTLGRALENRIQL
jgi:recombination protein RecR